MPNEVGKFIEVALVRGRPAPPWKQYLSMLKNVLELSIIDWQHVDSATVFERLPWQARNSRFWEDMAVAIFTDLQSFGLEAVNDGEEVLASWREDCMLWKAFHCWPAK